MSEEIQVVQGEWNDRPKNAVVSVKAGGAFDPWGGGLAGGSWFHVVPAETVLEWPAVQGRRYFTNAAALVQDCREMRVHNSSDATAQAVIAAWPNRTIFGRPVRKPVVA